MSDILLCAKVSSLFVRRVRTSDGSLFAVGTVTDRDKWDVREWTIFANDPQVIDILEALRLGEPLAISGPFSATPRRDGSGVHWRLTAHAVLDVKRKKKSKTAKAKEERIKSDEWAEAPMAPEREALSDDLPF